MALRPEGLLLDPSALYGPMLDLGNLGSLRLDSFEPGLAQKRQEWATSGDSDGGLLVREPRYDNPTGSFKVRVRAASMDAAMSAIGTLEQKLEECQKISAGGGDGLPVLWTPAGASTGLTLYLLLAEITDRPVTVADGWFTGAPIVTVSFTRKPFLYGSEITGPTASGTLPILTVAVPDVPGDVNAEARLVLTDGSTQARRWVEWGLESRFYNAGSPSSLLIDSEDLVTSGFAGAQATRTGGYRRAGATHDVVSATLVPSTPVAVCGTGDQPHVGTFRIKARLWCASTNQLWRLVWQDADGSWSTNPWAQPIVGASFSEVDLGTINVDPVESGTQKWSGGIESYTTNASTETGEVDYLLIYPVAEGYGRIGQPASGLAATVVGYDDFAAHASSSVLNTESAVIGGAWATSGATTDFTSDGSGNERRSTTADAAPRFAVLGTSYTDTQADVGFRWSSGGNGTVRFFAIARYVDTSNYAFARLSQIVATLTITELLEIGIVIGGVENVLGSSVVVSGPYGVRVVARANGQLTGYILDAGGNVINTASSSHTALQTGGALQSGKSGFADYNTVTPVSARSYSPVTVTQPAAEQLAINSTRSLEIRSDSDLRQSVDGASYGDIPSRGSRLFIPPAGAAARTTRIVARATRNDLTTGADVPLGDTLDMAIFYVPRYLAVPRS